MTFLLIFSSSCIYLEELKIEDIFSTENVFFGDSEFFPPNDIVKFIYILQYWMYILNILQNIFIILC